MSERVAWRGRVGAADPQDVARRAGGALDDEVTDLQVLPGGRSSITYSARTGAGARVVIKVAPPGLEPVRNRDVLRQARVLAALGPVEGVAVPDVLGEAEGKPPDIPPLFVMSFAPGEAYEPRFAEGPRPASDVVYTRGRAAVRMLARLHHERPVDLGVTEPATGLDEEVERWRSAIATCPLPPELATIERRCHQALLDARPEPVRPAVLHGDWRLGNMQCEGPVIRAVIDWEIWSVGDPRVDLAWMRTMHDPRHPTALAPDAPTLDPDDLVVEYRRAGGGVADIGWFDALVRYKQAAASALLVKNADKRGDSSPHVERMRRGVGLMLDASLARLS